MAGLPVAEPLRCSKGTHGHLYHPLSSCLWRDYRTPDPYYLSPYYLSPGQGEGEGGDQSGPYTPPVITRSEI